MKSFFLRVSVALILIASVSSCRKHDYREIAIDVPEMRNAACIRAIGAQFARSPGIQRESVKFDVQNRRITLVYDSLVTADKNIEFAVAKAGFVANGIPADPRAAAALPPECRQ
jgi:copper chaperone CopZ